MGVDPELARMCEEAGVRHELVHRSRHVALMVEGRQVLVMPNRRTACDDGRARTNARCCLRRYLRSLQSCPA